MGVDRRTKKIQEKKRSTGRRGRKEEKDCTIPLIAVLSASVSQNTEIDIFPGTTCTTMKTCNDTFTQTTPPSMFSSWTKRLMRGNGGLNQTQTHAQETAAD